MSHFHPGLSGPFADLPTALWSAAHWIWERRGKAKRTGFPFSEESITETVLLDMACELSDVVHIVAFTKPEEGKTGADWEWCIYDDANQRYLRFLTQAKVLDVNDKVYAHIDRFIGNSGVRQIDRLAETSRNRGVPAIYAFYNHLTDESRVPDECACHMCTECWGASVAPLSAVLAALPDKSFDTLKQVSMPWVCLLCPVHVASEGPGVDMIDAALAGLRRLDGMRREQMPDAGASDLPPVPEEPDREPPNYLRPLLDLPEGGGGDSMRQKWVDKLAFENPGVDGVVLIEAHPIPEE